jgi:SAM-dependent methyltransferase
MDLHPLAQNFDAVAAAYERGRPDYPAAVVGALAAELGLERGDRVLDLAAGTGKLSQVLLAAGFDLVAVEPLASPREVLAAKVGAERVLDGVAEAIPLPDASVAAVTAADSFHWFDRPRALEEIRRVLAPGGGLAILSVVPDWKGASWAHELGTLLNETRPEHPHFDGAPWQEFVRAAAGWGEPRQLRVTSWLPARPERIVDHVASISWVAAMPGPERRALLDRVSALVGGGETPAELPLHVMVGLASRS